MATMNLSLPTAMKTWVEAEAAAGDFSNTSDYMRDLIRKEQERRNRIAAMQAYVDEARASGVSPDTMSDIRERALAMRAASGT